MQRYSKEILTKLNAIGIAITFGHPGTRRHQGGQTLNTTSESHNATPNLLAIVPYNELNYAREHLIEYECVNDYDDYFRYIIQHYQLQKPATWHDAFQFLSLMKGLVNGHQ